MILRSHDYNEPTGETMSEGSDLPGNVTPMQPGPMDKMAATSAGPQVYVPVSAVSQPGEDEHMNAPGVGDVVEFHVQGKIHSIEGDQACVTLESANGEPLTAKAAATSDTQGSKPDELAQLREESAGRML
jgi:hypothetical protein